MGDSYFADAKRMIQFAAPLIGEKMTDDDVIRAFGYFANGVEKLLKHGLEKINPLFILVSPEFKHSASTYKSQFVAGYTGIELEKAPNLDVISFRVSLGRLKVFSASVGKHSQLLHTISTWRDVLAHRPSGELDASKIRTMLVKDAPQLIEDLARDLGAMASDFLGTHTRTLIANSSVLLREDDIQTHMESLLERHRRVWEKRRSDAELVAGAHAMTRSASQESSRDFINQEVPCPACDETAIVRIEPDYDFADGAGYISGVYPIELRCHYCDLHLMAYEEFNYINLDETLRTDY